MRKLKCGLAILMALIVLLGSIAYATDYGYFPDVPSDAGYAEAVNALAELGIIKGDQRGNFNPNSTITRAEFATMMCRVLEVEDDAIVIIESSFDDVPSTHWACGYVTKAVELGLVSGYGDGNFGPEDTLTYEQAVKVLVCAWGYEYEALTAGGYPDGYVSVANNLSITKGTTNSKTAVPRSIVATLIHNVLLIDMK